MGMYCEVLKIALHAHFVLSMQFSQYYNRCGCESTTLFRMGLNRSKKESLRL